MITLSILTPTIPSRLLQRLPRLVAKIGRQIDGRRRRDLEVEHLILFDNKRRSIGAKRDDLVSLARGKYLAFVDDDDDICAGYVNRLLEAAQSDADVLVFDQEVYLEDDPRRIVRFGLEFDNEDIQPPGRVTHRKPFHVCAWRTEIARQGRFGDIVYCEDWHWVQQVLPLTRTQHRIARTLHVYRWSRRASESPPPGGWADEGDLVVSHEEERE